MALFYWQQVLVRSSCKCETHMMLPLALLLLLL
jgi:hypothetical protein